MKGWIRRGALACSFVITSAVRAHAHAPEPAPAPALGAYFGLGIEHILLGFDHLVFLLGLVVVATRLRTVILAASAFTLAHSLTLALAVCGVATVSPRLVEPLIALSVAYVGLANFWDREGTRRHRLTFAFGLVHGFGFAGALAEIGLPMEARLGALALFNLGVEAGQLLVLAVVFGLLTWLRRYPPQLVQLVRLVNMGLIVLGVGWALSRTLASDSTVATDGSETTGEGPLVHGAVSDVETTTIRGAELEGSLYADVAPQPLAERVCATVQRLPRERRAACSGGAIGVTLEGECTRVLSAALASSALRVDGAAADACVAALQERYSDCEFTNAVALQPPAACLSLWEGQREAGERCRSSLECRRGLRCHGLSTVQPGVCGSPRPAGASCGLVVDPLVAYLPDRAANHPECAGSCSQGRCSG